MSRSEETWVAPTEDKFKECHLRWFGHVRWVWQVQGIRGRERLISTWCEVVRKDMIACGFTKSMDLNCVEWKHKFAT